MEAHVRDLMARDAKVAYLKNLQGAFQFASLFGNAVGHHDAMPSRPRPM